MSLRKAFLFALLASSFHVPVTAQQAPSPAEPQAAPAPAQDDLDSEEEEAPEIVVTGQRERGAVLGDIPPEIQFDRREIRSLGASNLSEVLDAIAPQTASGRGRGGERPVILLNGRRISGFSEIRDIPPEAIVRVDVFPEEVALRYGYRADQRVVNFVLRQRFRAATTEANYGLATAGGRDSFGAEVNLLRIDNSGRTNFGVQFNRAGALLESERDIAGGLGSFRTLLPETDQFAVNGTINRTLFGDVSTTVNGRFEANDSESRFGLRPDGSSSPLRRQTEGRTGHLGLAMNGDIRPWRWSLTANYDRDRNLTLTDNRSDPSFGRDRARSTSSTGDIQLVANGALFRLPAGEVNSTLRAGFTTLDFTSETRRTGLHQEVDLSRDSENAQASIDVPIASRRNDVLAAIGNISANFNAEVEHLSDFGTLRTLGYGLSWSPIEQLSLIASVTDEDGAPSVQQLGNPVLQTPNVRVFDFVRGETVEVTTIEGGNPALTADNRHVFKLGMTLRPLADADLSVTANYVDTSIKNPIQSFPAATAEIEAAFPERFTRDSSGRLLRIDTRPVNFAGADRTELRWGINFSKSIGPQPPEGGFRGGGRRGQGGRDGTAAAPPGGQGSAGGGRGAGRGGGGGFGGFGGGGRGGRLQLGLYHTWRFEDRILIREGGPELDLLNGSALGSRGGRPRHELEFQANVSKNGFGGRLTANWQSATNVLGGVDRTGGNVGDLRFSDLATVNLRLFADLGAQRALVSKARWLRGTRVSLVVDNLFNSRVRVRDAAGLTPISYQPDYLDPLGRSVRLSIRKLFF